jgi:hypothetical protein
MALVGTQPLVLVFRGPIHNRRDLQHVLHQRIKLRACFRRQVGAIDRLEKRIGKLLVPFGLGHHGVRPCSLKLQDRGQVRGIAGRWGRDGIGQGLLLRARQPFRRVVHCERYAAQESYAQNQRKNRVICFQDQPACPRPGFPDKRQVCDDVLPTNNLALGLFLHRMGLQILQRDEFQRGKMRG